MGDITNMRSLLLALLSAGLLAATIVGFELWHTRSPETGPATEVASAQAMSGAANTGPARSPASMPGQFARATQAPSGTTAARDMPAAAEYESEQPVEEPGAAMQTLLNDPDPEVRSAAAALLDARAAEQLTDDG
jgi:hypothetical protein